MGREHGPVPSPLPAPPEMAQCPTDACLQYCPTWGLPPGRETRKMRKRGLEACLAVLLRLPFFEERMLIASRCRAPRLTPCFSPGLRSRPRGRRQLPFPAQPSPGEEALAMIMENCPAKNVVAGKASEGD